ncbi:MAG: 2-hydroxychromene-2-carboxylate isomerase [Alphaproteobacteria bacterium]|nr:2-hydroxychromene-2-carboxylate isomerase [Alphaproteobacteria bacterium]
MTGTHEPPLVFWFEFASPYSYIAASRIEAAARASRVAHAWRPFLLGPILTHRGFADSPFNLDPRKGQYMWRDVERLCARDGVRWRRPSAFPRSGLLAARVAHAAGDRPWVRAFCLAVFRANFAEDRDIAATETIGAILNELGQEPSPILGRANAPDVKQALRTVTEAAEALGIFGAPTFQVGQELFWGQDRLDDAVAWAGKPAAR